jgi:hypothetical protein
VATKTARQFLLMLIRALDYCPPFDITFGDYLRALVTADYDMVPDDRHGYRVALIESFRRWGILPEGLKTLSEEQLRWPYARIELADGSPDPTSVLTGLAKELSGLVQDSLYQRKRSKVYETLRRARIRAHDYLEEVIKSDDKARCEEFMRVTGLELHRNGKLAGLRYDRDGLPSFEVHAVQPTLRVMPDGDILKQLIISITQRRRKLPVEPGNPGMGSFDFPGGCTLVFDLEGDIQDDGGVIPTLRYAIKRALDDDKRLAGVRAHRSMRYDAGVALRSTYFNVDVDSAEPFCMLHSNE